MDIIGLSYRSYRSDTVVEDRPIISIKLLPLRSNLPLLAKTIGLHS